MLIFSVLVIFYGIFVILRKVILNYLNSFCFVFGIGIFLFCVVVIWF